MVTKLLLIISMLFNPNSMYANMSEKDIYKLEHVIQHEMGSFSLDYKRDLASLLYNRLYSDSFPDDVSELLYAPNQFHGAKTWATSSKYEGNLSSKYVIWEIFTFENPSHDGTYYYNPAYSTKAACRWFEKSGDLKFVKSVSETHENIAYETRYFKDAKNAP